MLTIQCLEISTESYSSEVSLKKVIKILFHTQDVRSSSLAFLRKKNDSLLVLVVKFPLGIHIYLNS